MVATEWAGVFGALASPDSYSLSKGFRENSEEIRNRGLNGTGLKSYEERLWHDYKAFWWIFRLRFFIRPEITEEEWIAT